MLGKRLVVQLAQQRVHIVVFGGARGRLEHVPAQDAGYAVRRHLMPNEGRLALVDSRLSSIASSMAVWRHSFHMRGLQNEMLSANSSCTALTRAVTSSLLVASLARLIRRSSRAMSCRSLSWMRVVAWISVAERCARISQNRWTWKEEL